MRVQTPQRRGRFLVICSDERKRGMVEVLDGGAFAQELGIERNAKVTTHPFSRIDFERRHDDIRDRTRQYRASNHNDVVTSLCLQCCPQLLTHTFYVPEI